MATKWWPLATAQLLLAGTFAGVWRACVAHDEGHFVYALDDAYIQMAMAKNLAVHGVWGITRFGFSSSSSSPLWVLLLAGGYRVFGVSEIVPLLLNATCAEPTVPRQARTPAAA